MVRNLYTGLRLEQQHLLTLIWFWLLGIFFSCLFAKRVQCKFVYQCYQTRVDEYAPSVYAVLGRRGYLMAVLHII